MSLVIAGRLTPTNVALHEAAARIGVRSRLLPPELAAKRARPGEIVLGRVDVLPSLDGPEPGLNSLRSLEKQSALVLNRAGPLLVAHDKLETARVLGAAGVPHPPTAHVLAGEVPDPWFGPPYVVKPRFGSWGAGVLRCMSVGDLRRTLAKLVARRWFREQGALVQELVPNAFVDLRFVIAAGQIVGAVNRIAAADEWRTNVALGGHRSPATPTLEAQLGAVAAAEAIGADLVGVDLLPTRDGYVVLELNGCVDFTADYSLGEDNVFERAIVSLVFPAIAELARITPHDADLSSAPTPSTTTAI